jgi:hypothetical protein
MLRRMRWKYAFASLLFLAFNATTQERGKPYDDRWREMVLERTTPDEAIARFGIPTSDASVTGTLNQDPIWRWLTEKEEATRFLTYKNPTPDVELLWLVFRNGKLVEFSLKLPGPGYTLSPNALANIYGADFQPLRDSRGEVRTPRDFERRENMFPLKDLPNHVAAVTKKSFIVALVVGTYDHAADNAEIALGLKTPGFLPGRVALIKIVSRTLENKAPSAAGAK